ncbi:MAG: adenylate/guanylate cyclase domain-containing protein [Caldilineaceae bacterium]
MDEAAERFDLQRIKTIGETYMAVCGLTTARLDHALRTVNFAQAAMALAHQRNENLTLQIGIDSGPVISGVVGSKKFQFELWGETVNIAHHIQTVAELNTILVTENVYKRVHEQFNLRPAPPVAHYEQEIQVYRVATGADGDAAVDAPTVDAAAASAMAAHRAPAATIVRAEVA